MKNTQVKRTGPTPLCLHTGLLQPPASLFPLLAQNEYTPYDENELELVINGIQKYQSSNRTAKKPELISHYGYKGMRILSLADKGHDDAKFSRSLLIIPSLINNAEIFNLNEERSFILWLQQNGIEVFLLDWGDIRHNLADVTMEVLLSEDLPHMIDSAHQRAQNDLDILGYCIGGTLLLGAQQFVSSPINNIILLAAPWDFHAQGTEFFRQARMWSPYALQAINNKGYLPALWTQYLFAMLDMPKAGSKFKAFADMQEGSNESNLFIDVEDWLNSGCDIPKELAQYCIGQWFAGNVTAKGEWFIGDTKIDLSSFKNKALIIASENDNITPLHSAKGAALRLTHADVTIMKKSCGHISYIAGRTAVQEVWQPLLKWLQE